MRTMVFLVVWLLAVVATCDAAGLGNLAIIEFDTQSYDSMRVMLREVEYTGATPRHIFAPNIAIVDMHGLPHDSVDKLAGYTIFTEAGLSRDSKALAGHPARAAYLHLVDKAGRDTRFPPAL